ncbi:MAG: glycosyltransferase, partial [Bryobacteraceae bacterium]
MRVCQIVPSFHPAYFYGGPTHSVYHLCRQLARRGCEVRVLTTNANGPSAVVAVKSDTELTLEEGLSVRYCAETVPEKMSFRMLAQLPAYIRWADVVHLTAVYSFPVIPALALSKLFGKPVVWSPRGSLQRWKGSTRPVLKTVWEWACGLMAPKRLALHVTSQEEAKQSTERFPSARIAMVPNGVDIPEALEHKPGRGTLRLVYLGRLHPIKGIGNLLEACSLLRQSGAQPFSLTIAGGGDPAYARTLVSRIMDLGLSTCARLAGEVSGPVKQAIFENADIVVVPSFSENFGMVVAEALAHGVPVIASDGTPWQRLKQKGCGLWVPNDARSLADAISLMSVFSLQEMGQRGREWMEQEYGWDLAAARMMAAYTSLLPGAEYR